MVKNSGNDEWRCTSIETFELNLLRLGCSNPVHYFKTAGVIQISGQQHFQVHLPGKDKLNKKSSHFLFNNCNIQPTKPLSVSLISNLMYIFANKTYPNKIQW